MFPNSAKWPKEVQIDPKNAIFKEKSIFSKMSENPTEMRVCLRLGKKKYSGCVTQRVTFFQQFFNGASYFIRSKKSLGGLYFFSKS